VRDLTEGKSRYETLRSLGLSRIEVGVAGDPEERVNAARLMIPMCWFDAEQCQLGLERLRGYRKRWNRSMQSFSGPLHDQASHGADAFGAFALNRRGGSRGGQDPRLVVRARAGVDSWMG
jgi:phage terminase large subunit